MEISKPIVPVCVASALLLVCVFSKSSNNTELTHNKTVVCYIGTYASTREGRGSFTISNVDPSLCTHVVFAFAHLRQNTSIYVLDSWNTFIGDYSKFHVMKRQYPNVKFIVSVGGWYDGTRIFSVMSQSAEERKSFAKNVVDFVSMHGFDGADLCWLFPSKRSGFLSDKQNFVALLKELKTQLHQHNYLLTALLGSSFEAIDNGYDMKAISETTDLMSIMCYDYNGFWSAAIGPNSAMDSPTKWNVRFSISYMLKSGADPHKLALGIALYGRLSFATRETMAKGRPVTFGDDLVKDVQYRKSFMGRYTQDSSGIIAYGEICVEMQDESKWTRYWDNSSSTPYIVHQDKLISYDDPESTVSKVKFAMERNLAGIMVFSLDLDDFMADCYKDEHDNRKTYPLLRAINHQIEKYSKEIIPTPYNDDDNNTTSESVSSCSNCADICSAVMLFVSLISFGIG